MDIASGSFYLLKLARFPVLADIVPVEIHPVHSYIHAMGQSLNECEGTSKIEDPVRTPELVRNHGAGKDHGLVFDRLSKKLRSLFHRIRSVRDDNSLVFAQSAIFEYDASVGIRNFQAVHHHECSDIDIEFTPAEPQHLLQMAVFEEELPRQFVIFLVESPTRNEDHYSHDGPI